MTKDNLNETMMAQVDKLSRPIDWFSLSVLDCRTTREGVVLPGDFFKVTPQTELSVRTLKKCDIDAHHASFIIYVV